MWEDSHLTFTVGTPPVPPSSLPVKLSPHDLQQLDEDALRRLPAAGLRHLALTLLADLKEARERLAQNPHNSSRPPSSRPPWERGAPADKAAPPETAPAPEPPATAPESPPDAERPAAAATPLAATATRPAVKRQPGKQVGAPGVGRTQVLTAHTTAEHRKRPAKCIYRAGRRPRKLLPCSTQTEATAWHKVDARARSGGNWWRAFRAVA
jgi:hypothetical protein